MSEKHYRYLATDETIRDTDEILLSSGAWVRPTPSIVGENPESCTSVRRHVVDFWEYAEPVATSTTICACCGKTKKCPLRRDEMGGYVCLTCVDERLNKLMDQPTPPRGAPPGMRLLPPGLSRVSHADAYFDSTVNGWTSVPPFRVGTVVEKDELFARPVLASDRVTPPEPPEGLDPKGAAGALKPQLQLIPPELNFHLAGAIALGAKKYGPWNWRTAKVESMTYVGASRRHLDAYLEGEDIDPESGVHHLGHVAACCAIVLDARKHGTLVDNRPLPGRQGGNLVVTEVKGAANFVASRAPEITFDLRRPRSGFDPMDPCVSNALAVLADNKPGPDAHHCILLGSNLRCDKPYQLMFGDGKTGGQAVTMTHAEWEVVSSLVRRASWVGSNSSPNLIPQTPWIPVGPGFRLLGIGESIKEGDCAIQKGEWRTVPASWVGDGVITEFSTPIRRKVT